MTATVVIPAYSMGRVSDVVGAVASAMAQTHRPEEIIVAVDHNPELVFVLRDRLDKSVRVELNNGIIGGAETRNLGIRKAQSDIVVFLDDDAWAAPYWLERLLGAYDDPEVMAAGGKTISFFPNKRPLWFPEELDWMIGGTWKGHPETRCEVRNLIGPNMSFRRSVCDRIGYMRSELGALPRKARAGDETEFYIRLKKILPDAKILYVPTAVVYHTVYDWKMTASNLIKRAFSDGYWKNRTRAVSDSFNDDKLSSEKQYLHYLLTDAIPVRVMHFWNGGNLSQASAIVGSALCFGAGYIWGEVRR